MRKEKFKNPPLFATQISNKTMIETDLIRFEHKVFQKMFCDELVMERHRELIIWMNEEVNNGRPSPYYQGRF
jgi:hypothetical protein